MTTQELIIGHFEKTLSRDEAAELSGLMQESPDARALFDQHRSIDSMMMREAADLAPSSALDAAVIGAALGTATEVVGGGAGFWSGAKIAAGISALIVGGVSVFMATSSETDHVLPANNPPAVRQVPAIESPALPTPAETPAVRPQAAETKQTATERKPAAVNLPARSTAKPSTAPSTQKASGGLDLNPQVQIHEHTKVNEGRK